MDGGGVCNNILEALAPASRKRWYISIEMPYRWQVLTCQKMRLLAGKKRGKGTKVIAITDARCTALSIRVESASSYNVSLVEKTQEERFVEEVPESS